MKVNKFAVTLLCGLALGGCTSDGKDGADGINGTNGVDGENGINGIDGKNANSQLSINLIGRAILNTQSPEGAAEIVAFQASKNWVYAINSSGDQATVEIIDISNLDSAALTKDAEGIVNNTNLTPTITLNVFEHSEGDANSIAIDNNNELLAVAMAAKTTGEAGVIAFYDISGAQPSFIKNVTAGFLPDSVAFSPDGKFAVAANEGEPSGDYTIDPVGSISVININNGVPADTATNLGLESFNGKQAELEAQGMKFTNPTGRTINGVTINTTVAMDLEPEYVSFAKDSSKAFITLQENNGIVELDLSNNNLVIYGLGYKDWGQYKLDASDKDNRVNLRSYNGLYGLFQPDTIANFTWKNANFTVIANEGDGREYFFDQADEATCLANGGLDYDDDDGCLSFIDEIRAEKLTLGANFTGINNDDDDLGRLKVIQAMGDENNDGIHEKLFTYGARSFSILDQNGEMIFDSGDDIERITASIHGAAFNNDEDVNEGDTRSDAKGPEPEALAIGTIGDKTYAFIGLERMGGVMVYDITNPYNVTFSDYFYNRGLTEDADITGDLAPEGMAFISADQSPTNQALLVIGNELSGSVAIWQISAR